MLFTALALGSLGLKAAAGAAPDSVVASDPSRFERAATSILEAQHFSTTRRTLSRGSVIILGSRGDCRVAVRDARWGSGIAAAYALDVRDIGPVTYLYRGHRYSAPPGLIVRVGRLEFEILDRIGARSPLHVLTAFAGSPSCGASDFSLSDVQIES